MVAALALQLRNVREWLPSSTHVDEPWFVEPAARMAANGTLDPGWFGHPASTLITPLAALYRLAWGRDALAALSTDPAPLYLVARGLSIAYAIVGLLFVFLSARRLTGGARGGLVAVAIVAASPPIVELCATARSDGASLCFGALALTALFRALDHPTRRTLALGGVALGAAIATKYYFAVFGALLALALVRAARERRAEGRPLLPVAGQGLAAGAATLGTFALLTPYFFLRWSVAMRDLRLEAQAHLVGNTASWGATFTWYATRGLPELIGQPLVIVLVAAMGVAIVRRRARPLLPVAAALAVGFVATTSMLHLTWTRWLVPVAPLVAALAASLIVDGSELLARRARRDWVAAPLIAAVTLALLVPSLRHTLGLEVPRAATLARRWIAETAPAGAFVAMDGDGGDWLVRGALNERTLPRGVRVRREVGYLADAGHTLNGLRCEGVDHLVLNGLHAVNVVNGWEAAPPTVRELYRRIAAEGRLVTTFGTLHSPERRVIAIGHLPCDKPTADAR